MTITATETKEVKREIEIDLPAFFKTTSTGAIALIDEDNIYRVFHNDGYSYVQNGSAETMKSDLIFCKESNRITEQEFWSLYEKARLATDLNPRLIFKNVIMKEGSEITV